MTTDSTFSKGSLASIVVFVAMAFAAGCGDDDEVREDGGDTPRDSSVADVTTGDDDAGVDEDVDAGDDDDAGPLPDGATAGLCSAEEEEFLETPVQAGKSGDIPFYDFVGLYVLTCMVQEQPEVCFVEQIDKRSDGVVGESCASCLLTGVQCLGAVCESVCNDDEGSEQCVDCRCGVSEGAATCVRAFELCAGYTPTLCLDSVATL